MSWIELSVFSRHPQFAEEILLANGALSVSFRDAADDPQFEPWPGEMPLWKQTRTVGLFPQKQNLDATQAALLELLPDGKSARVERKRIADRDWIAASRRKMRPVRFGKNLWVCPTHRKVRAKNAVVVKLDPGLAFGTGAHPTTALCLEWLSQQDLRGKTVLDYGCGSGILAIAALKLGAARAVGVDLDPQAPTATLNNARANKVAQRMSVCLPHQFKPKTHDLVIANILANPLIELAPKLTRCLKAGGPIALAGLLKNQAKEIRQAYAPKVALKIVASRENWALLSGVR
ncbi:MAG: 50S ribosomal protein L11 methyltransferase [Pseudomonadota bacterium]